MNHTLCTRHDVLHLAATNLSAAHVFSEEAAGNSSDADHHLWLVTRIRGPAPSCAAVAGSGPNRCTCTLISGGPQVVELGSRPAMARVCRVPIKWPLRPRFSWVLIDL